MKDVVLMATPCTKSLGGGVGGTNSRVRMRGAKLANVHHSFLVVSGEC